MFEASAESHATLNGRKIVVQQISEGSEAWSSAVVGTDWPHSGERREQTRLIVGLMADQVNECNLMGSPALGLCNVAAGRFHAYWHLDLNIWDVAAASLILQRAGGVLTDAHGMSWLYSDGGYIATNTVIHGWALNCNSSRPQHECALSSRLPARALASHPIVIHGLPMTLFGLGDLSPRFDFSKQLIDFIFFFELFEAVFQVIGNHFGLGLAHGLGPKDFVPHAFEGRQL